MSSAPLRTAERRPPRASPTIGAPVTDAANRPMRRPDLFIVGAPKTGTSSLHRYLEQHPDVFMSRPKEPGTR